MPVSAEPGSYRSVCFICEQQKTYPPHLYPIHVRGYGFHVCRSCFEAAHDGWQTHHDQKIEAHLYRRGVNRPERLDNDLYPQTF